MLTIYLYGFCISRMNWILILQLFIYLFIFLHSFPERPLCAWFGNTGSSANPMLILCQFLLAIYKLHTVT